jgi:Tfp pilus assembly protein PilO
LSGEGGGGTIDDMEARVAGLEDDMREIRTDLKAIRTDLTELKPVRLEVAEIKGRLSQLPSTKEMIGLVFLVLGGAFAIFKYGMR